MESSQHIVSTLLSCGAIVALLMNIVACYRVARSEIHEARQKILQCILVWLFPILGAGLVLALMREPKKRHDLGYVKQGSSFDDQDFGVSFDSGKNSLDHGGQHDAGGH